MMDLPASPFDACDQATGQVNSQSLVRYKTNDYSVPVAYGHRDVWLRGYVDKVVIGCGGNVIASHPRCWDREDVTSRTVIWLFLEQLRLKFVPVLHRLQGRLAAQGVLRELLVVEYPS